MLCLCEMNFDGVQLCFPSVDVVWGVEMSEIDDMFYEGYESSSFFVCSVSFAYAVLWYWGGFVVVGQFCLLYCCCIYVVGLHDVCQFCEEFFVYSIYVDLEDFEVFFFFAVLIVIVGGWLFGEC